MISSLLYHIIYGLLFALSLLPLRLLYILSDGLYLLVYYVIGYREEVVMDNLAHAFPEKSPAQRKAIAKTFYKNFIDNFIETLKLISAGPGFIKKHFVIENPEVYEQFYTQGKKVQIHLGHVFNWELASLAVPFYSSYPMLAVYMPIKNKIFDRLLKKLRTKTGVIFLPATDMRNSILPYRELRYLLALVADQAPGNPAGAYWLYLFGRPTAMIRGPERGARTGDVPAIFAEIFKVKRGYYRAKLELGADHPANLPEGELTRRYVDFLQQSIARNPSMWLWTHRRWKHKWKNEYQELWIGDEAPPAEVEVND